MSATAIEKPPCLHREGEIRECLDCGACLSSANEDTACALHGGWTLQRHFQREHEERMERLQRIEELAAA